MRIVYRIYAYDLDKRYIVGDCERESDALEYCVFHEWQLTNSKGRTFQLGVSKVQSKPLISQKAKETFAAILIAVGMIITVAAGASENIPEIISRGAVGLALTYVGAKILEV